jgi:hypothetical protein
VLRDAMRVASRKVLDVPREQGGATVPGRDVDSADGTIQEQAPDDGVLATAGPHDEAVQPRHPLSAGSSLRALLADRGLDLSVGKEEAHAFSLDTAIAT